MARPERDFSFDEDESEPVLNGETVHFRLVEHARDILVTEHIATRLEGQVDQRDLDLVERLKGMAREVLTPEELDEAAKMAEEEVRRRLPISPIRVQEAEMVRDVLHGRVQEIIETQREQED